MGLGGQEGKNRYNGDETLHRIHRGGLKMATLANDMDCVYHFLEAGKERRDGCALVQLAESCPGLYPVHDHASPVKAYRKYN